MDTFARDSEFRPADDQPEPKRRKVRKGTQSCWECRRRKVRCTFTTSTGSVCDGCKRRNATCISQEFADEAKGPEGTQEVDDGLNRLESTVAWLAEKVDVSDEPRHHARLLSSSGRSTLGEVQSGFHSSGGLCTGNPAPIIPDFSETSPTSLLVGISVDSTQGSIHDTTYDDLSRKLISAWPSQSDLELILTTPLDISGLFHGSMYAPYSTLLCQEPPSPREVLRLPPAGSHPVLIARKLLALAICLQGVPHSSTRDLAGLSTDYRGIMASAVETVRSCTTSKEELLESVEGIDCVMMEGMYYNNAGNLRCAWQSMRRAMLVAQMIGLHRDSGVGVPSSRFLEAETRSRIYPEHMWFRLVQWDRYLSLMLGLPQGTSSSSFADHQALEGCTPMERMQRIDCAAGGYILQRNEAGTYDLGTTQRIDRLLLQSASYLPSQWWLPPRFSSRIGSDMQELEKIIRAMDQFTHYHLVTQLHLPYLLRSSTEHEYDYSKITAINSSREALQRFVSYLGVDAVTSFCRGINLIAFISCTVICIAHIDAHRQRQVPPRNSDKNVLDTLVHQRQSDRAMMELALESMERMARESDDVLAAKMAGILTHLLAIEADSALKGNYITSPSLHSIEDGLGCSGKLAEGDGTLQIYIPYLGSIKFERGDGSRPSSATERGRPTTPVPAMLLSDSITLTSLIAMPELRDEREQRPLATTNLGDSEANGWPIVSPHHTRSQRPTSASASYNDYVFDNSLLPDVDSLISTQKEHANNWGIHDLDIDSL